MSSRRCASKIAASLAPARVTIAARWRWMSATVSRTARVEASELGFDALGGHVGHLELGRTRSGTRGRRRRRGTRARRAPRRRSPRATAWIGVPTRSAIAGAGASSKSRSASARIAATTSAASRPEARTRIRSPRRTPSVATELRLLAFDWPRPVVTLVTRTSASNALAVRTSAAAGRAWSPCSMPTVDLEIDDAARSARTRRSRASAGGARRRGARPSTQGRRVPRRRRRPAGHRSSR